jgi:hypothetical protein
MRRLYFVLLISVCALFAQTDARSWLDRGVDAFKNARYDEATGAFQRAVDLDPSNMKAHLCWPGYVHRDRACVLRGVSMSRYAPSEKVAFAPRARLFFPEYLGRTKQCRLPRSQARDHY